MMCGPVSTGKCSQHMTETESPNWSITDPTPHSVLANPPTSNYSSWGETEMFWKTETGPASLSGCLCMAQVSTSCLNLSLCWTMRLLGLPSVLSNPALSVLAANSPSSWLPREVPRCAALLSCQKGSKVRDASKVSGKGSIRGCSKRPSHPPPSIPPVYFPLHFQHPPTHLLHVLTGTNWYSVKHKAREPLQPGHQPSSCPEVCMQGGHLARWRPLS